MNQTNKTIEHLKEQISNQDKLASLGMLSAGIVHEIQNPLNFVINFSKLSGKLLRDMNAILSEVQSHIPESHAEEIRDIMSDLENNISRIEENGLRASSIIRGILLYSRGADDYMPTDLRELAHQYIWLSYHATRANHKNFNAGIHERYEEDLPLVNLIPQDISRVVLNVMNNACYAVYDKSQQVQEPYSPVIKVDIRTNGECVELLIEDNGTGIPAEIKDNLYTPFFTTKPVGEGTGLGLSISKSIIENKHNGAISVETKQGEYTRFTISLPLNRTNK
ncbi:MAG: GHKL domain-containing protein [Tannerellaceae bacterium]|jgi:signal transduction histidine kinase|nr:GHKL domain-containing protein [Tannerellaceae bacterium]